MALQAGFRRFLAAVREGDETLIEAEVLRLSRTWRPLAPLALCVGAFVMLFQGLRRVWTNWRLVLVEVPAAMWIWLAMLDLKAHVLGGRNFQMWRGPLAVVLVLGTVAVTVAAVYLNVVSAFAITASDHIELRPAFIAANRHALVLWATGVVLGALLGASAFVVPRWGLGWAALALGISVALLMLASVLVPARILATTGAVRSQPRRDRIAAAVIGAVLGVVVCAPTYTLARVGVVLLDKKSLFILGVVLLVVSFGLQSGVTGAVKAIKMSAKAAAGRTRSPQPTTLGTPGGTSTAPSAGETGTSGDRPGIGTGRPVSPA